MNPAAILQHPRWQPLARFVERWYAQPLGEGGATAAELDAAEARIGRQLPVAMRAGHRSATMMRFVPCWPPGATEFTAPR